MLTSLLYKEEYPVLHILSVEAKEKYSWEAFNCEEFSLSKCAGLLPRSFWPVLAVHANWVEYIHFFFTSKYFSKFSIQNTGSDPVKRFLPCVQWMDFEEYKRVQLVSLLGCCNLHALGSWTASSPTYKNSWQIRFEQLEVGGLIVSNFKNSGQSYSHSPCVPRLLEEFSGSCFPLVSAV